MKHDYESWLRHEGYDEGTVNTQLYRVRRVEEYHGDLDTHYETDGLRHLLEQLTYSTEDARRNRPNPSKIPFVGNTRNNLASYKSAVLWYQRYRRGSSSESNHCQTSLAGDQPHAIQGRLASTPKPTVVRHNTQPRSGPRTLIDFDLNGRAALEAIIASSQYRTTAQAVASLALFSHPQTVRQTGGRAVFSAIRDAKRVGQLDMKGGRRVLLDDNKSPTDAFLWANGISRRGPDTQFNHVYAASTDPDAYTALPNLCMTPRFHCKTHRYKRTGTAPSKVQKLRTLSMGTQWTCATREA